MINAVKGGYSSASAQNGKSLVSELTKALDPKNRKDKPKSMTMSVLESSKEYQQKLAASRQKSSETKNAKKRVNYSHKALSSAILRCKTSQSARMAASKARREVSRLKSKAAEGTYDADEISLAISHAKAMEIVAKKKARHLAQEEMVKVSDKAQEMEEKIDDPRQSNLEKEIEEQYASDQTGESQDIVEEMDLSDMQGVEDVPNIQIEDLLMESDMVDFADLEDMADFLDMDALLSDTIDFDLLEETPLDELLDFFDSDMKPEMTEEDFKKAVIKHRNDEYKAIVHADALYLKGMFEHFESLSAEFCATV